MTAPTPAAMAADSQIDASGRHPGVQSLARYFDSTHLSADLAAVVAPFRTLATELLGQVRTDSAELTVALRHLLESKDAAVRARLDELRAG